MGDLSSLTKQYLDHTRLMQLATSLNGQPWACTVHFYADKDLNLYWLSTPEREHSKQIAQNPVVAATVMAHEDRPGEEYVVGISISGTAEQLDGVPEGTGRAYIEKFGDREQLLAEIAEGSNPHRFYRLKPTRIVLFDSKTFPDDPRKELNVQ